MKTLIAPWSTDRHNHWKNVKLKYIFTEVKEKNYKNLDLPILSLSYGQIIRRNRAINDGLTPASFSTYNIVKPGDIVLRLTDLQNDQTSLRSGIVRESGLITSAYITLRCSTIIYPEYAALLFRHYDHCKVFYSLGSGIRQSSTFSEIGNLPIILPSLFEQNLIAKKARTINLTLDKIELQQKNIRDSLKEYRNSLITRAVSKGLNPNVPMRDSGISCIGSIPNHWEISTLGRICHSMRNGYVGPTAGIFRTEGVKYIQSLHVKDGEIFFNKKEYYVEEDWANKHPKIYKGNLLIVQSGDIGQVAIVRDEFSGCNCHALIICNLNTTKIDPD